MPTDESQCTYEYKCKECRESYTEKPLDNICRKCGSLVNKISKFEIKIPTPELVDDDLKSLRKEIMKDSCTKHYPYIKHA